MPQWQKDMLREVKLVLEEWGVHLGQCSSEVGVTISWSVPGSPSLGSATKLGGHDWKTSRPGRVGVTLV